MVHKRWNAFMGRYINLKNIIIIAGLAIFAVSGYYAWQISQDNRPLKPIPNAQIAFVNLSRVHNEAMAFIKFKELIELQYKGFKNEIHDQEKEILDEYALLEQQKSTKSKEKGSLQKRREELDKKMKEMSSVIHERKTALHQNFSKITENIEATIRRIVESSAKKHQLNLVFNATVMDASVVLYGGEELDITDEVLAQLNYEIPTVQLDS